MNRITSNKILRATLFVAFFGALLSISPAIVFAQDATDGSGFSVDSSYGYSPTDSYGYTPTDYGYGSPTDTYGYSTAPTIPSDTSYGYGTNSTDTSGYTPSLSDTYGYGTNSTDTSGYTPSLSDTYGYATNPADTYGYSANPTDAYGYSVNPTDTYGYSVNPTDTYGYTTAVVPGYDVGGGYGGYDLGGMGYGGYGGYGLGMGLGYGGYGYGGYGLGMGLGYGGYGMGGYAYPYTMPIIPSVGGDFGGGSVVSAPTTVANNDNTTACTTPNSCNTLYTDNGNTTISSPTTISYNNAGSGSYPVYPPTYQPPTTISYNNNISGSAYPVYVPTPYQAPSYNAPTCTIWISNNPGVYGTQTVSWSSTNATTGSITGIGSVGPSGSTIVNNGYYGTYAGTFTGPGGSTTCYASAPAGGVAYNPTPYVTLSQVPYTGLDLGPVGTALYWLFLVLWCAVAAYLIAVKRVHNRIIVWIYGHLFGDPEAVSHPAYKTVHAAGGMANASDQAVGKGREPMPEAPRENADTIDDFILTQINRHA